MSIPKTNQTDSIEYQSLPSIPKRGDRVRKLASSGDLHYQSSLDPTIEIHESDTAENLIENEDLFLAHVNSYLQNIDNSFSKSSKTSDQTELRSHDGKSSTKDYKLRTKSYTILEMSESDITQKLKKRNIVHLPKLHQAEASFLQLVSSGNINDVEKYLRDHPGLNINCVNFQGITALSLAVQNRCEAMVEFLLRQPNIEIGDTVLHSIRVNNIRILEMLLDARKKVSPGLEFAGVTHSTDYPEHVTPLILAAHLGHYEIVALLISRGHTIARPHPPKCLCIKCKSSLINEDPLFTSSARLAVYQAISSPAYLVHVSSDPILAAFRLTAELSDNALVYLPLATEYFQLMDCVSVFAVELIDCCRTSEEVELILNQTSGSLGRRQFVLPRLLMAVDYKQKEFVAHPNTQQVLESYWIGDWYNWRYTTFVKKIIIITSRIFITPFILFMCVIAPRHRLVRHWQIPLNKLITHAAAYFVFLGLVFHISNQDKDKKKRGPPDTGSLLFTYKMILTRFHVEILRLTMQKHVSFKLGVEFLVILYVCGYTWSAIRMCLMQGPRRYFSEMWNWAEIIMIALFSLTFALWIIAAVDATNAVEEDRKYWTQYDPTLLAEGTFCLATIFAYLRLMLFCQLNYHLGPLQVSLGKMTIDIYKYIIVFTIIISAFAAGLARFYQYYDGMVYEDEFGMKTVQVSSFTSLVDTLNTLFWALFCMAPLESADVVLENTRDGDRRDKYHDNRHAFTERVGYFCFGCFEVISVIVVLNMLIATMSNTFQRVNDNVAIEWTFGRTQVYVDYMWQTTLPPPYNMIPTASGICSIFEWLRIKVCKTPGSHARWSPSYCCYIEHDIEAFVQQEHSALMSVLVQRYFRDKKSSLIGKKTIEGELEIIHSELAALKSLLENLKKKQQQPQMSQTAINS